MFGWIGFLVGIFFILVGGFLVLFFPSTEEHQPDTFAVTGIVLGLILIIAGGVLMFVA